MGNKASIEIQVDWDSSPGVVNAGQEIRGSVLLNVFRPVQGGKVRLMLHGKEKTTIQTRITGSSDTFHSERRLLAIHQTLKEFRPFKKIPRGEHCLPFKIVLPASIPSSQQYPEGKSMRRRNGFRVQYQLQACLGKVEACVDIHVNSSPLPLDEPFPFLVQPISFPISTLNVIKQGEVVLGARVAETAVGRGEKIKLRLACRNDSTIDIRRVAVKLLENVEWTVEAQGLNRKATKTLVHMRDIDLPSLSRDGKDRTEVRRLSKNTGQRHATYQAIYDELSSATEDVEIFVPEISRDSHDGQIVKVNHVLTIKLQTRSLSSNASISIPIRVGTPRSVGETNRERQATTEIQGSQFYHESPTVDIPVAQAVEIDPSGDHDDDVQSVIVLSGDAVLPVHSSLADLEPVPPPFPAEVSLVNLLLRIDASLDNPSLISSLLMEAAWVRFFCSMSQSDYAAIVRRISPEDDQPRVALLLSEYVNGGDALTCAWVAVATRATNANYRATTVQRLLPHCSDLPSNHELIRHELNAWELTVTQNDFRAALDRSRYQ